MKAEKRLTEYICRAQFNEIPRDALNVIHNMLTGVFGTTIAGSGSEGCEALVQYYRDQGGKQEATILIHGGKIPAQNAVMVNSVMARALDFDDAMAPGIHIGASAVPAALGAAELAGGCSGKAGEHLALPKPVSAPAVFGAQVEGELQGVGGGDRAAATLLDHEAGGVEAPDRITRRVLALPPTRARERKRSK